MVIGWLAAAFAAPVVCDPAEARRILVDARIDEVRAPVTHPWLIPGLARDSGDAEVVAAVSEVCEGGGQRFIDRAEAQLGPGWSAYALVLSSVERRGCTVVHHRVALSVGIGPEGTRYGLLARLPDEQTPDGTCDGVQVWRDEVVLAGQDESVRLILVTDHAGEGVSGARVVVRRATARGWREQVLLDPAPPRTLDPRAAGPVVSLAWTADDQPLVVVSHDRTVGPCAPVGGQVVWQLRGDDWVSADGREALTTLARAGLWRYAGDDGWLLILAQDDDSELALIEPRLRRIQRRSPEPLYILSSSDFPNLIGGFAVIAPGPWPTEDEARAARRTFRRGGYLKQAWEAVSPCRP